MQELMCLPKCKEHGQMVLRPIERQTYEQKFCGTWYDCQKCGKSTCYPSKELLQQLKEMTGSNPIRVNGTLRDRCT